MAGDLGPPPLPFATNRLDKGQRQRRDARRVSSSFQKIDTRYAQSRVKWIFASLLARSAKPAYFSFGPRPDLQGLQNPLRCAVRCPKKAKGLSSFPGHTLQNLSPFAAKNRGSHSTARG
jgi:hypothetical protein